MDLPLSPRIERRQVHELAGEDEPYDLVLFMGVFYHLRYPLLALDTVARLVRRLLVFQSLTVDDEHVEPVIADPAPDYALDDRSVMKEPGWPRLAFIEHSFATDPTNWLVPDHAAIEALLRSTGFESIERIEHETYLCAPPEGGVEARRWWSDEEWRRATGSPAARPGGQPT
jgi:tRNA (mo5U34)-methyltransferase